MKCTKGIVDRERDRRDRKRERGVSRQIDEPNLTQYSAVLTCSFYLYYYALSISLSLSPMQVRTALYYVRLGSSIYLLTPLSLSLSSLSFFVLSVYLSLSSKQTRIILYTSALLRIHEMHKRHSGQRKRQKRQKERERGEQIDR